MTDKRDLNSAGVPGQITLDKIISQIPGMIFQLLRKPDGAYSLPYASDAINELFGCSPQDVRNDFSPITKVIIGEDKEKFRASIEESARTLLTWQCEYRVQRPGQTIHWLLARAIPEQQSDGSILWHGYNIDITERRQTGQQLETQCALLTAIMNSPSDITIFSLDKNYCYTAFNEKHREEMKKAWDADIMIGRNLLDCIRDPELREKTKQNLDRTLQGASFTEIQHRPEPDLYYELIWGPVVQNGKIVGANVFIRDVTERKRLEAELEKNNRALRLLSATNQALIHATAELALMNEICQIVIKSGYRAAWVGMKEEDEGKSVRPVAQEGFAPEYLKEAQITWADNERGRGPTGTAIRTGKPAICRNMLTDPNFAPWREQAKKNNYQSSIALPLLLGEKIFGALNIYAAEPEAFNEQEVKYLNELAADLAFGLDYLRGQEQRKLAAEKIRQSEAKFAAAFKASPDLMAITRASDGLMLELNDGYTQLLGYTREESIGQTTTKVSIWANPADRDKFVADLKKSGQVNDFETTLRRKDGSLVTVLDSARAFDIQGEAYILSTAHDITERKLAEATLRAANAYNRSLIDSSLDPLVTISPEGTITDVNPATEAITGCSRSELIGKDFSDYFTDPERARSGYREVLEKGLVRDYALEIRHKDGQITPVLYNATTYRDEAGKMIGVFAAARDITERKLAEKEHLFHLRFMESLDKVNRTIQGTNDLDQMMHDVLAVVLSIFDCDRAWLFFPCDPDATMFRVPMEVTKPEYPGAKALNTDVPLPSDMAQNLREALGSVSPVTFTAGTEKPINKVSAEQFGVKSMMMIALYPKSGKPWVFGLHQCSGPRLWTDEEKNLFKEISNRLSDGLNSLLFANELRESEARFRSLYDSMNEGMAVHQLINDQQGNPIDYVLQDVNPAFERLTGIKKAQAVGQKATKLYAQEKAPYLDIYARVVVTGKPEMFDTDYEAMNKSFSISAFALGEGRFATVFFDITERKKTAEEISKKVSELERFNKITMGREDRIIELKQEIKRLKEKYGEQ
ncbi:MAG: PAS domain S-box protein [Candidatus Margulisiibacteriota bacterium]